MTEQELKEAAKRYARYKDNYYGPIDANEVTEDFIAGAKWAIEEYKNKNDKSWDDIIDDFIDEFPCLLPIELVNWLNKNYYPNKKL